MPSQSNSSPARNIGVASILGAAILALFFHARYYFPFLADDALISLRYAYRLIEGHGLSWTDGQPVEGYSNLLWVLLNAFLYRLGIDLIDASRFLGFAGTGAAVFSLVWYWRSFHSAGGRNYAPLVVSLFFFCMSAPIAVWTIGGLEQPLFACLIGISIPMMARIIESPASNSPAIRRLALVQGLICITRPDGVLFLPATLAGIYLGRRALGKKAVSRSHLWVLVALPALFLGGQVVFRFFYYGELVPNTALVKVSPSWAHVKGGVRYAGSALWSLFPLSALAIVSLVALTVLPRTRAKMLPLLILGAVWLLYVVFIGGDVFPAYRHFVPIILIFSFALMEGTAAVLRVVVAEQVTNRRLLLAVMSAVCAVFVLFQFTNPANKRAVAERWEWDGQVLGLLLKQSFSEQQPLVAVTAAGCLPYWSKLPALDMLGLNDHYLPRHRPADFGRGPLGHELGDGKYILSRQPDIVVFHTGEKTDRFRSGKEMLASAEFHERYTPVKVVGRDPYVYAAVIWLNKYSSRIGVVYSGNEIKVPGYLVSGEKTAAYLDESGKLVLLLPPGESASIQLDSAAVQKWNVEVRSPRGEHIVADVKQSGTSIEVTLHSNEREPVEIEAMVLKEAH